MRRKSFNVQAAAELISFAAFGGAMLYLVVSGKYLNYVTPRMMPYLLLSAAAMLVWAVSLVPRLFRPQYRPRTAHCFVLVIPLLLLLLPHGQISTVGSTGLLTGSTLSGLSGQSVPSATDSLTGTSGGASSASASSASTVSSSADSSAAGSDTPSSPDGYLVKTSDGQVLKEIHGYDAAEKTITVSDDEFYSWCSELFLNPDRFVGYQITLTGYVLKDIPTLGAGEFVPARLMMSCCVADLQPCGVVCEYDHVADLTANSWVTVTGTIEKGEYQGSPEPQIHVASVTPAQEVEGYVYPY